MTKTIISRRAALGGLAFAVAGAPVTALAAANSSSEFQHLLAVFHRLRADETAYDTAYLEPMADEYARRAALVPHVTAAYDNVVGGEASMTTALVSYVKMAERHTPRNEGGWLG